MIHRNSAIRRAAALVAFVAALMVIGTMTLTVTFDFPIDLVIPFLPSPSSWQTGTARASMRIEQLSAPGGPGGC